MMQFKDVFSIKNVVLVGFIGALCASYFVMAGLTTTQQKTTVKPAATPAASTAPVVSTAPKTAQPTSSLTSTSGVTSTTGIDPNTGLPYADASRRGGV